MSCGALGLVVLSAAARARAGDDVDAVAARAADRRQDPPERAGPAAQLDAQGEAVAGARLAVFSGACVDLHRASGLPAVPGGHG
jgi:hypothetical protein